jgi:hypothetical protein
VNTELERDSASPTFVYERKVQLLAEPQFLQKRNPSCCFWVQSHEKVSSIPSIQQQILNKTYYYMEETVRINQCKILSSLPGVYNLHE